MTARMLYAFLPLMIVVGSFAGIALLGSLTQKRKRVRRACEQEALETKNQERLDQIDFWFQAGRRQGHAEMCRIWEAANHDRLMKNSPVVKIPVAKPTKSRKKK